MMKWDMLSVDSRNAWWAKLWKAAKTIDVLKSLKTKWNDETIQCSRWVATACQLQYVQRTKSLFQTVPNWQGCTGVSKQSRHYVIIRRVLIPELQRVAESRWHLQRIRPIVRQVNVVSTGMLRISRAIVFYIDSIWFKHLAETRLCALQLSILTNVYLSCLPCPRHFSRYSNPAANWKLASFSAASCWCGTIWIRRYQRHSTCSMWWHRQRLWCACSPFTTSSSKTIVVVKLRRIDVFMRGHVSETWDTNGSWLSAAAACCETARLTTRQ